MLCFLFLFSFCVLILIMSVDLSSHSRLLFLTCVSCIAEPMKVMLCIWCVFKISRNYILLSLINSCLLLYSQVLYFSALRVLTDSLYVFYFPNCSFVILEIIEHICNICFEVFSANSSIYLFVPVDWFSSFIRVIFSCCFTCLVIFFYWIVDIINLNLLNAGFCFLPLQSIGLCSGRKWSSLQIILSFWVSYFLITLHFL